MKNRLARVCEVLKRELSSAVTRDLSFDGILVTISSVDVTPDLRKAHVFFSAIGEDWQRAWVLEKLNDSRAMLQMEIAKRVVMKHTPQLHFHLDDSIERGTRVLEIMEELGLDVGNPGKKKDEGQ